MTDGNPCPSQAVALFCDLGADTAGDSGNNILWKEKGGEESLNSDLPANLGKGNALLAVTSTADLSCASLVIAPQNSLTLLDAGDDFTLVSATDTLIDGGYNGTQNAIEAGEISSVLIMIRLHIRKAAAVQ